MSDDPEHPRPAVGRRRQAADRARRCGNKHRYRDELDARRAAADLNRRAAHAGRVWPYECPYCAGWHVGRRAADKAAGLNPPPSQHRPV